MATMLAFLFFWSFKSLPNENWQILGAVPKEKMPSGNWSGINLTYYGVFNANAYTLATALVFILLTSVGIRKIGILMISSLLLALCMPASKIIARIVEKKVATFTVGGASFTGMLVLPWLLYFCRSPFESIFGNSINILTALAAVSIGYAFGEGIGRLACISYGCCYGKPLDQVHPMLQKVFRNRSFVFHGKTKKIAYAHGYDEKEVVPVQAITAVVYSISTLIGLFLFLYGYYAAAFLQTLITTQLWRYFSEFLRADYRGNGKFSAYQWMAVCIIPYAVIVAALFSGENIQEPALIQGLKALWDPVMIIFFQGLWIAAFLFTGRSRITGSKLTFHLFEDRI